jgi:transcriptional regulator with XRE-family HTH domain
VNIKSLSISQRLRLFLDNLGIEQQEFANALGISKQVVSNAINGRTKYPKSDFLIQLIVGYPNLNLYWLLLGEGEMFTNNIPSNLNLIQDLKAENEKLKNDLLETQQKVIELFEKINS